MCVKCCTSLPILPTVRILLQNLPSIEINLAFLLFFLAKIVCISFHWGPSVADGFSFACYLFHSIPLLFPLIKILYKCILYCQKSQGLYGKQRDEKAQILHLVLAFNALQYCVVMDGFIHHQIPPVTPSFLLVQHLDKKTPG